MGLITDQRTDYDGVEVLTDQRYIPKQKLTHITTPGNTCQEKIVLHCLNFDPLLLTKNPSRENQKPVKWWVLFAHQEWDFWVYWDCLLLLLYQNICSLTKLYEQGTIDNSLSGIRIQCDMQKYERNVIFTYRFDWLCDWPTNWLRHRLTVLLTTDWLSDWLYHWRLTDWVTDYITDDWRLTDWLYYWRMTDWRMTDWVTDYITDDWLTDLLLTTDSLTVTGDWLTDWLYYWRLTTDWLTVLPTTDWLYYWRLNYWWMTDRMTDWLTLLLTTDWPTVLLTNDLLTDQLTDWLYDWVTDWPIDCVTDWQTMSGLMTIDRPPDHLGFSILDWLTDWMTVWQPDWLKKVIGSIQTIGSEIIFLELKYQGLSSFDHVLLFTCLAFSNFSPAYDATAFIDPMLFLANPPARFINSSFCCMTNVWTCSKKADE